MPEFLVGGFFARVFGDGEDAGQDADDVAIEDGRGLAEGDARNCAGGIGADAGQGKNFGVGAGKFAVMPGKDFAGGLLHVPNAGVIAETFPKLVDRGGVGISEALDVRQRAHPAFPIGNDGFDLGLLKHDFAYIYAVRITAIRFASPW